MEAHTVTLMPNGDLEIRGQNLGKSFSAGLWDRVEACKKAAAERALLPVHHVAKLALKVTRQGR